MTEWRTKQNLTQRGVSLLTAFAVNSFSGKGAPPVAAEDLLPFRPPRLRLTAEETEAAFDRFFSGVAAANGANRG